MYFSDWVKWEFRDRLNDDDNFDIPHDFGLLGIYLLAISPDINKKATHEAKEVVYIGLSTNVLKRLDLRHTAVNKIKKEYGVEKLYCAAYHTGSTNSRLKTDQGRINTAYLHYLERKMIWEYGNKFNKLPKYNLI